MNPTDPNLPPRDPSSPPVPPPPSGSITERQWAMFGHLSALTGLLTGGLGNIIGPLIIWQIKKDQMPFAAEQAREALNFNVTWFVAGALLGIVTVILTVFLVGILLWPLVIILPVIWIVLVVIAGVRANDGVPYRYPLTLRLI